MTISPIIHKELCYQIYGLCFKTHNALGRYRNEQAYADYLDSLLKSSLLKYVREWPLPPSFTAEMSHRNIPDFVIENAVVVDLKAKRMITKGDYFQMKRYLSASGLKLGLIINFRQEYVSPKRILN